MNPNEPGPDHNADNAPAKPIVIYGGPLFNGKDTVYPDGAVYIQDGLVVTAGTEESVFGKIPKTVDIEVFDTLGCLIMPGLIDLRSHFYQSLALGLNGFSPNIKTPSNIKNFWSKYDLCLDDEMVQLSALVSILNAIKSGVTTIFDLHSSPLTTTKILDNIASVTARSGIQAVLSYEISERNGEDVFIRSIEENQRFIESYSDPKIQGMFGIHISEQMSDKALSLIREAAAPDCGFQIELTAPDQLDRLEKFDLLNARSLVSCSGVIDDDSLKNSNACFIGTNSPNATVFSKGHNRGIATEGTVNSIFQMLRHEFDRYSTLTENSENIYSQIAALYSGNVEFAGRYFPGKPGILEKGSIADIVIFDYIPATPITNENYLQHLLFGMPQGRAKAVMTGGNFIYNDHTYLTLDDEIIISESQKAGERLFKKFNNR